MHRGNHRQPRCSVRDEVVSNQLGSQFYMLIKIVEEDLQGYNLRLSVWKKRPSCPFILRSTVMLVTSLLNLMPQHR